MKERIISFRINEAVMPDRDPPWASFNRYYPRIVHSPKMWKITKNPPLGPDGPSKKNVEFDSLISEIFEERKKIFAAADA